MTFVLQILALFREPGWQQPRRPPQGTGRSDRGGCALSSGVSGSWRSEPIVLMAFDLPRSFGI